jgi:ketosteroid isomerase-like protein
MGHMSSSADEQVVRRLYQAIADRDLAAAQQCFADDAVWRLPGTGAIAGEHRGWPQIRDNFLAKLGPLSGGTFTADLIDVAVGEHFVVAVQHATGSHAGRELDITGCQLMTVRGGLIREVRGHYSDQAALDAFWSGG